MIHSIIFLLELSQAASALSLSLLCVCCPDTAQQCYSLLWGNLNGCLEDITPGGRTVPHHHPYTHTAGLLEQGSWRGSSVLPSKIGLPSHSLLNSHPQELINRSDLSVLSYGGIFKVAWRKLQHGEYSTGSLEQQGPGILSFTSLFLNRR